jgi:hypothetical protein
VVNGDSGMNGLSRFDQEQSFGERHGTPIAASWMIQHDLTVRQRTHQGGVQGFARQRPVNFSRGLTVRFGEI